MKPLKLACAALLAAFSAHAAAVGGLADVTVFDRSEGRQLPVYWHEGRAYVVGKPGNEYSVRIRNRQREDVLGVISVDGVNVITGETARVAAKRLRPRPVPPVRHQRLAQEPRLDRGVLLHVAAGFLCRAHRAPGQRRRDRRGASTARRRSPRRSRSPRPSPRASSRARKRGAAGASAEAQNAPRAASATTASAPAMAASRPRRRAMSASSAPAASPRRPSSSTTTATATCWRAASFRRSTASAAPAGAESRSRASSGDPPA